MKRSSIPGLAAAAVLAAGTPSPALTFLELATGDEALFPDARSVAMGRTRIAEGAGAFTGTVNPAALAWAGRPIVAAGGGVQKLKETRRIPAYDSFDAFLVESIYVLNDDYQYRGGIGITAGAPAGWNLGKLGAGLSWAPERDWQYDYTEEVRDNNSFTQPRDRLLARNDVQSNGSVDAVTLGLGWAPDVPGAPEDFVAVGLSAQVLLGAQNLLHRTWFVPEDSTEASHVAVSDLTGTRVIAGLNVRPDHRLDLALTWRSAVTVDGDFVREGGPAAGAYFAAPADPAATSGAVEIEYPAELGLGVAYRPRAKVRTTLRADAVWADWSAFRHGLWSGLALNDVWTFRLGLEHVFYNGMPVRFGFHYQPSPQDEEVAATAFTVGGGLDLGPLRADLGFEFANRDYRFDDLFDDAMFGGNTRTRKDLVDESALTVYGTVTYDLPGLGG
jgi:hypothetical protein